MKREYVVHTYYDPKTGPPVIGRVGSTATRILSIDHLRKEYVVMATSMGNARKTARRKRVAEERKRRVNYVGANNREYETFEQMVAGEPDWAATEIRRLRVWVYQLEQMLLQELPPFVPKQQWLQDTKKKAYEQADHLKEMEYAYRKAQEDA